LPLDSTGQATRQFVGNRHHDLIARRSWASRCNRCPNSPVSHSRETEPRGTVDQHATQIEVAALADAEQLLLAPVDN
jgi:hypothetical protein